MANLKRAQYPLLTLPSLQHSSVAIQKTSRLRLGKGMAAVETLLPSRQKLIA